MASIARPGLRLKRTRRVMDLSGERASVFGRRLVAKVEHPLLGCRCCRASRQIARSLRRLVSVHCYGQAKPNRLEHAEPGRAARIGCDGAVAQAVNAADIASAAPMR